MGAPASEVDIDHIAASSGPYRGGRLLNILVINEFSGAAYRCAVLFIAQEFAAAFPYAL